MMTAIGTLGGFPNPPALWLRRAKPACAYAIMGTIKGFPCIPAMVRHVRLARFHDEGFVGGAKIPFATARA